MKLKNLNSYLRLAVLAFFIQGCIVYALADTKVMQELSHNEWKCVRQENTAGNPPDDPGTQQGYFKKDFDEK